MLPPNENQVVRGLHVVLPGKTLAWFGLVGLLDVVWSTWFLSLPPFFPANSLFALSLTGLSMVALLRWPVFSPWIACSAIALVIWQGLSAGIWALTPLVIAIGVIVVSQIQRHGMRCRPAGWGGALACVLVALGCVLGAPGLRESTLSAPGVQTHIDAMLTLLGAYAIFMVSLRPLAPPVNNRALVAITVLGGLLAAVAWFVLAEQDRQIHLEYFDQSYATIARVNPLLPLNQWLPDLIFAMIFLVTWLLTRTVRMSVILLQRSEALEHASAHDFLTGLPNKRYLIQAIDQAHKSCREEGENIALILLDLNGLKLINDSLGLHVGDQVLKEVSCRIRQTVPSEYGVARLEGDEFVVLMRGVTRKDTIECAGHLLSIISQPYDHGGMELHLTASAGLTMADPSTTDPEALLRQADLAITSAKQSGRNTWREYASELSDSVDTRLALRTELQKALDNNHFVMHYQPIINGNTGRIVGAEALIRWPHAQRGHISPAVFVPLAEETGLIHALSRWVLEATCRDLRRLQNQAVVDFPFVINVSPLHFQRTDFIQDVQDTLARHDLSPGHIEIELTEGLFLDHVQETIDKLRHLQSMGIKISIDDFGTGYSSLRYLKNLPIDKIKIDRSFVEEIVTDRNDAAISKAIIGLAHHLNLRVVAEGVETAGQFTYLQRNGCDEFQGWLFARAEPVDTWAQWLRHNGGVMTLPVSESGPQG